MRSKLLFGLLHLVVVAAKAAYPEPSCFRGVIRDLRGTLAKELA